MLKSSRLKIARAREHLDGLISEFHRFSDSDPYTMGMEHDLETGQHTLVYNPTASIPDDWYTVIGELLFNLRSALDHAVYELSMREKGSPVKNSEFPIFDDKEAFSRTKRNGDPANGSGLFKIRGLPQRTQSYIETLQPYHVTDPDNTVSLLLILHELNIRDKHRELLLCRRISQDTEVTTNAPAGGHFVFQAFKINLDEKTTLGTFYPARGFDGEVYMDADLTYDICFHESCCTSFLEPASVVLTLNLIGSLVQRIIGKLEEPTEP